MSFPTACPVCAAKEIGHWSLAKDYEYFSTTTTYTYYNCTSCRSIFLSPLPVEDLRTIYPSNYYSFVAAKPNIITRIKEGFDKQYFKKLLKRFNAPQLKVLDVGGGTGWLSDLLKAADNRVALAQIVDIDADAKAIAESKGHTYYQGTLESFESTEKFHLILLLNLIEHVSDPLVVLKKAGSLLEKGGSILIKTPNTDCFDARLFRNSYWGGLHCPRHWVLFSEKSFRYLVSKTDLKIDSLKYTQGAPFWAFSIIAALYRKRCLHISATKPIVYHSLFPVLCGIFAAFDFLRRPLTKTAQMFIVLDKKASTS
jgi:2-polyprenyl-3-methyl-5-hydroxy-6-metoxy-1,4-benzoquinol methylase